MATHTWIGNGGNWSDASHWSPASVPGSADNVVFNASSFSSGSQTVAITSLSVCLDMTWTGVTNTPTLSVALDLRIFGSLTLVPGMVVAIDPSSGVFVLQAASAGKTITMGSQTLLGLNIQGSGGGYTLQDTMSLGTEGLGTLFAGSLDTNGQIITSTGSIYFGNPVTLTLGSSVITTAYWHVSDGSTVSAASSTINVAGAFYGGGCAYGTVNFTGTGAAAVSGSNAFSALATTGQPKTLTFQAGTTQTGGDFDGLGGTAGNLVTLQVAGGSSTFYLSKPSGTVSCDYLSVSHCSAVGGATWQPGAHSVDGGNNAGWLFPVDATTYPSGVAGNASVGSPTGTGTATASPYGLAGEGALGNASVYTNSDAFTSPTGVTGNPGVGAATATGSALASLFGMAGDGGVGSVTATGTAHASPAGVAGTPGVGDLSFLAARFIDAYPGVHCRWNFWRDR